MQYPQFPQPVRNRSLDAVYVGAVVVLVVVLFGGTLVTMRIERKPSANPV